ncbi:hypothetical protein [Phosphitispora fastidiosa]|uniref:hypothetical protein n=1 Tax=Phosphitispora fastidiosa TaxID=2837202 RepID=UPI001E4C98B8|nr:hypothetical protein [Phosphitispora fastidiosa]MBU7008131.1 tetratricopeptide (TPR) repeat protein [Phosphitispora fastidiosa]
MTRYYITVLLINILFAAFFYFKLTDTGLSTKAFIFIGSLSLLVGISFPLLAGFFNIYVVIGINLLILSLGAYYITQIEQADPPGAEPEHTEAVVLIAAAAEDITAEVNTKEEALADEEIKDRLEVIADDSVEIHIEPNSNEEAAAEAEEVAAEEEEEAEPDEEPEEDDLSIIDDGNIENETVEVKDNTGGLPGLDNTAQGEEIMISEQRGSEEVLELIYSYVDRGFDAKIGGKLDLAIKYFSSALDLNPPPDLKSMLAFDVHSMYRELGQYTEAKQCMKDFLEGISGELSSEEAREITINIKYIEILQETLNKANTPNLPFSKLPALIKVSVEGKVDQWLNNTFDN